MSSRPARAPLLPWVLANIGLLLVGSFAWLLVVDAVRAAGDPEDVLVVGNVVFGWVIVLTYLVPGAAVYLVLLALFPAAWSRLRARVIAIALSPVISAFIWIVEGFDAGTLLTTLGLPLFYSLIVRLRVRGAEARTLPERAG